MAFKMPYSIECDNKAACGCGVKDKTTARSEKEARDRFTSWGWQIYPNGEAYCSVHHPKNYKYRPTNGDLD